MRMIYLKNDCLLDSDDSDDSEFTHREKLDPEWMGSK